MAFTASAQAKASVTRYFEHYAAFAPALVDHSVSPETCYEQSAFLFWTIICTGARKYAEDPTVLERVAQRIMEIARTALFSIQNPIPALQAALILCLWPAPIDTMWKDPSHVVSGTALQLAVQNGLHSMGREQDFRRVNVGSNSKSTLRAQLWIHCVVISQRFVQLFDSSWKNLTWNTLSTSLCDGLPFWILVQPSDTITLFNRIEAPALQYQFKTHLIQTAAITAIAQNAELESQQGSTGLQSLISVFDTQIQEVSLPFIDAFCKSTHN